MSTLGGIGERGACPRHQRLDVLVERALASLVKRSQASGGSAPFILQVRITLAKRTRGQPTLHRANTVPRSRSALERTSSRKHEIQLHPLV